MPPFLFFWESPPIFLCAERRLHFITRSVLFAPQKKGYGLPLCLGVKKGVECFS